MASVRDDPALQARSPHGWRRWLTELGHREPERIAQSGAILLAGAIAAIVLLYAFAWVAYEVLDRQTQALDLATLHFLQQFTSPQLTLAAEAVSLLGSQAVFAIVIALLSVFLFQRRWGAAVTLVVVAAGAQILNDVLKNFFHRTRPEPVAGFIQAQQFSFPSGHATVAAAFYLYLAYLTWNLLRGHWRIILCIALVALVLLIGLARLYLEAHYLSDVIAGYVSGLLWTDTVILGSRVLSARAFHASEASGIRSPPRAAPPALR